MDQGARPGFRAPVDIDSDSDVEASSPRPAQHAVIGEASLSTLQVQQGLHIDIADTVTALHAIQIARALDPNLGIKGPLQGLLTQHPLPAPGAASSR